MDNSPAPIDASSAEQSQELTKFKADQPSQLVTPVKEGADQTGRVRRLRSKRVTDTKVLHMSTMKLEACQKALELIKEVESRSRISDHSLPKDKHDQSLDSDDSLIQT